MSGCATVSNDLYYIIYTYMRNGSMSFSQLMKELADSLDCPEYNPDYDNLKKKAKTVYDLEFMAESTSYVTTNKLAYAIFKVYDTVDLTADQIINEINAAYPKLKNKKDVEELADEVLQKIKQKYAEGNVEITQRTMDIIERNVSLDFPDDDYMSIPRKEILEFIRIKGFKVPAKNLPKSGLLNYIKKSYQGKTKQAPPSPRDDESRYESIKNIDVCNTSAYNKQQLYDYIKFKGWKLKYSTNSKEYLCKFIKEQSKKEPSKEEEQVREEKEEKKAPSRPLTPVPSKRVESKYEEEEDEEEKKMKPIYMPTLGRKLKRGEIWDNFTLKAVKMNEDDDDDDDDDEGTSSGSKGHPLLLGDGISCFTTQKMAPHPCFVFFMGHDESMGRGHYYIPFEQMTMRNRF